ncbi:MAG TPA: hypothetical protein V6D03_00825 [Candidatus Caenarcaniphilales bacterium]
MSDNRPEQVMGFACSGALVTLAAPDAEALIQFYRSLLCQSPQPYIPRLYAEFQLPGLRLGIFKPTVSSQHEFEPQAKSSISLCLQVNDLADAIAQLEALGYPPPGGILAAAHGREIYAYDPIGNRLILHQPQLLEGAQAE